MKTISFEENININRNNFKNIKDFFIYTIENYDLKEDKIELWIINNPTEELLKKVELSKMNKINFNNI